MPTPHEEVHDQMRTLIRREIATAEDRKQKMGWAPGSTEERCLVSEIMGMRRILAFVDPEPWR